MSVEPTLTSQAMEHTTVNGSEEDLQLPCYNTSIPDFLVIIIGLVGLAGNAVVIYLLGCRMQRNAISVYILNLAASDFLVLCCYIFASLFTVIMAFSHFYMGIRFILINIAIIPYITGLSILSAISTERCLSVLWPIWYRCHRPRHMSAIVCTLLWALSLLLSILEWYFSGFLYMFFSSIWWQKFDFIITAWLIFLFLTLFGSNLTLVVRILCGSRRMLVPRLYVTILFTVLVFLICALPFGIYWFLLLWLTITLPNFFCYFSIASVILCCVNSCANPIIYFFTGSFRQQHQTLKQVLQRALEDSHHESEGGDRHIQETLEMSGSGVA
ncbi:Mas-related G-protein coupled receptor member X1 [Fukomys damarensis]|uniref:Mas-related G-protein coupled receptor member X1 n=2 Tax=Fukomys damarensis TaxID=885580 RepID=A0A091DUU7_FUKDA|nr:Mas-related G-protein coupled receptor member X1 [Fukomys damarensis]